MFGQCLFIRYLMYSLGVAEKVCKFERCADVRLGSRDNGDFDELMTRSESF